MRDRGQGGRLGTMSEQKPRPGLKLGRKLLVATVGLATVSYVACGGSTSSGPSTTSDAAVDGAVQSDITSGNLLPPPDTKPDTYTADITSGNLVPPPDTGSSDAGAADTGTSKPDSTPPFDVTSGNLVPPPDSGF